MNAQYVLCVQNTGYEASLELRKVYAVIADETSSKHGLLRITDESGEDYLFPSEFFVSISLPKTAEKVFAAV